MELIKNDLKLLGISHDNFFSETDLVDNDLVNKAVEQLKKKNLLRRVFYNHPKVKKTKIGRK